MKTRRLAYVYISPFHSVNYQNPEQKYTVCLVYWHYPVNLSQNLIHYWSIHTVRLSSNSFLVPDLQLGMNFRTLPTLKCHFLFPLYTGMVGRSSWYLKVYYLVLERYLSSQDNKSSTRSCKPTGSFNQFDCSILTWPQKV